MGAHSRAGLTIGQNHQIVFARAGYQSDTGTDADQYFPPGGRWITNPYYRGLDLTVIRTGESTADATLQVFVQAYNQATAGFSDMIDGGTGTCSTVAYATSSTGERHLRIYPGIVGGDADGVTTPNTVNKWVDQNLPGAWRLRVRHGGTDVYNIFSLMAQLLK